MAVDVHFSPEDVVVEEKEEEVDVIQVEPDEEEVVVATWDLNCLRERVLVAVWLTTTLTPVTS